MGPADDSYDITVRNVPAGWTYTYTTPAGTFSGPSTLMLASGATASFLLEIDSQGNTGPASVIFQATSQNESLNAASLRFRKLNGFQVFLVDDDGGEERETYVEPILDAAGVTWDIWRMSDGELTATDLQNAGQSVFWMCGRTQPTLTPNDRAALGTYMDGGGKLFLSGCNIANTLCNPGNPYYTPESLQWFETYLHATYVTFYQPCFTVVGTPGDPIGDGIEGMAISGSGDNQQIPDGILPGPGANLVFTCTPSEDADAGIRWEQGPTQVVYFAFGIEGIVEDDDRNLVVGRIIDWFGIETSIRAPEVVPPEVLLAQNAPNPFNPITTISFELPKPTIVNLGIYDLSGQLVRILIDGRTIEAGRNERIWNGRDATGRTAAAGVYFYRLEAGDFIETKKMVLLK